MPLVNTTTRRARRTWTRPRSFDQKLFLEFRQPRKHCETTLSRNESWTISDSIPKPFSKITNESPEWSTSTPLARTPFALTKALYLTGVRSSNLASSSLSLKPSFRRSTCEMSLFITLEMNQFRGCLPSRRSSRKRRKKWRRKRRRFLFSCLRGTEGRGSR